MGTPIREGERGSALFLPGGTCEQLEKCVAAVWPGSSVHRLRPEERDALEGCGRLVVGVVHLDERWLSLAFNDHVGGLLHEVARLAADMGQPALVEDRTDFYSPLGFLAMTAYLPGKPAELRFYDPLRPELANKPIPESWMSRFVGYGGTPEQYALEFRVGGHGTMLKLLQVVRAGQVLNAPLWSAEGSYDFPDVPSLEPVRPAPAPRRAPLPAETLDAFGFVSGLLTLLLLVPISLALPALAGSMMIGTNFDGWWAAVLASWVLAGWMAFVPLRWPTGRPISWAVRLAWFFGVTALVALLMGRH